MHKKNEEMNFEIMKYLVGDEKFMSDESRGIRQFWQRKIFGKILRLKNLRKWNSSLKFGSLCYRQISQRIGNQRIKFLSKLYF